MQPPRQNYLRSRAIIQFENRLLGPNDSWKTKTMSPWKLSWSQQNVKTHLTNQKSRRKYVTRRRQARKKDDRRQPANTDVFPAIRLVCAEDISVDIKSRKYVCVMGYGWVFWKFDWHKVFLNGDLGKLRMFTSLYDQTCSHIFCVSLLIGAELGTICATFVPIILSIRPTFIRKQVITLSPDKDIGWSTLSDLFPTSKLSEHLQNALQVFQLKTSGNGPSLDIVESLE